MLISVYRCAYGGVNLRVSNLRELRLRSLSKYEPNRINNRQNRRPCGWFRDTFIPVPKLKGSNRAHDDFVNSVSLDIRNRIIKKIRSGSENFNLAESYVEITSMAEAVSPEPNEFIRERMNDILNYRANFNILYNSNRGREAEKLLKPIDMPHLHDAISDLLYISSSDDIKMDRVTREFKVENNQNDDVINPINDMIKTPLIEYWNSKGCTRYINYNNYNLPGRFGGSIYNEYQLIRNNLTFYDLGCEIVYKFTGEDKFHVVNQFITCKIPECDSEVSYGCLINNNGHILDTVYIFFSELEGVIYMISSGSNRNIQSNFIAEYIIYCQRSGLDINYHNEDYHVIALNGDCRRFFLGINFTNFTYKRVSNLTNNTYFEGLDEVLAVRISYTGSDGIHFICPSKLVFLLAEKLSKIANPVGLIPVNIRRMECGIFLPSLDIISNQSPFTASLSWTVHLPKVRNKTLFGHELFTSQIAHLRRKRVALLSSIYLKPGSVILSSVTRSPIGLVSSCVWSYYYNCRLSYAYISPEFAMHGKILIAKTKIRLPDGLSKPRIRATLKSGMNTKQYWALVIRSPPVPKYHKDFFTRRDVFNKSKDRVEEDGIFELIKLLSDPVTPRYRRPKPTF